MGHNLPGNTAPRSCCAGRSDGRAASVPERRQTFLGTSRRRSPTKSPPVFLQNENQIGKRKAKRDGVETEGQVKVKRMKRRLHLLPTEADGPMGVAAGSAPVVGVDGVVDVAALVGLPAGLTVVVLVVVLVLVLVPELPLPPLVGSCWGSPSDRNWQMLGVRCT